MLKTCLISLIFIFYLERNEAMYLITQRLVGFVKILPWNVDL